MTIEAIKEAIAQLPEHERSSLAAWLNELQYDEWDREMVVDFLFGGCGMALVENVKHESAEGNAVPFEKGLEQARTKRSR